MHREKTHRRRGRENQVSTHRKIRGWEREPGWRGRHFNYSEIRERELARKALNSVATVDEESDER